jgi:hypothetical protein
MDGGRSPVYGNNASTHCSASISCFTPASVRTNGIPRGHRDLLTPYPNGAFNGSIAYDLSICIVRCMQCKESVRETTLLARGTFRTVWYVNSNRVVRGTRNL